MIVGDVVPPMTLTLADGTATTLDAYRNGRALVVFFYPKAGTAGCTREAGDFSALADDFAGLDVAVLGVSRDTPAALTKFAAKHALRVDLASDGDGNVCDAFGTWGEKTLYGRTYMGVERATWLIGRDGAVLQSWRKVRVAGHAQAVLDAAATLLR